MPDGPRLAESAVMDASQTLTAVITGASSGIGAATALRLADAGYRVVLTARRADRLAELAERITKNGGQAQAHELDVTDRAAVDAVLNPLDRCDVLVANAGGAFGADPVATGSADDWRAMYEVNVLGTLNTVQALLPKLIASGAGTIVVMGSTAGLTPYEGGEIHVLLNNSEGVFVSLNSSTGK